MTAAALATSIADRILDEDAAVELAETPPDLTDALMADLQRAAASNGIDHDEAAAWARKGAAEARRAWLHSPAGRAALEAAVKAADRDREVMGNGIRSSQVRALERVTREAVARRFAERDSPRAPADDTRPTDATRAQPAPAGRATSA